MSRIITVFSTKGKQKTKIETDVTTWGELRPLVEAEGYDVESLHATENVRRTNLANAESILPEEAFTLFLRPKKTKSGCSGCDFDESEIEAMSFRELRGMVTDNNIKGHLKAYKPGKSNWTQLSTEDLRAGLIAFYCTGEEDASADIQEEATPETNQAITVADKAMSIKTLLSEIAAEIANKNVSERIAEMGAELDGLIEDIASLEEDKAELSKLIAEAKDIEEKSFKICQ